MKTLSKLKLVVISCAVLISCNKEKSTIITNYVEPGSAFVINEGNFGHNNGNISYISHNKSVVNGIYETANKPSVLGDVIQSFERVNNTGIICVNNSNKVVLVDVSTFKQTAVITQSITYPRYALGVNSNKAYISNWSFPGSLVVIDLNTKSVIKKITVGNGPEEMIQANGKVFVANSGGFGNDNTLSIINPNSDVEEEKITVRDYPSEMVMDAQGFIWILCKGHVEYPAPDYFPHRLSASYLVRFNPATKTIVKEIMLIPASADFSSSDNLAINGTGTQLYFSVDDKIYTLPITATQLPAQAFLQKYAYGLNVHPYTGDVWVCDAKDFASSGTIYRYIQSAEAQDSFKVGLIPNSIYFNE